MRVIPPEIPARIGTDEINLWFISANLWLLPRHTGSWFRFFLADRNVCPTLCRPAGFVFAAIGGADVVAGRELAEGWPNGILRQPLFD
jgi:hypothetical protein